MDKNPVGKNGPAGNGNSSAPLGDEELIPVAQLRADIKKGGFGLQVAQLRILMGQTQDTLAKILLTTRQSIVALEKCNSVMDLSDGMLFRLYYFAKELSENKFVPQIITSLSTEILTETLSSIERRANKL